jgi:WD40 repeat protein
MAEIYSHDRDESADMMNLHNNDNEGISQASKVVVEDDISLVSMDEASVFSSEESHSSNPYTYENRRAAAELDRSRCYPWSKYIDSNQNCAQKDVDGPNFAIAGGIDRNVVTWDLKEREVRFTKGGFGSLRKHSNEILCLDIPNESIEGEAPTVVSAGWDNEIRVWNLDTGRCLKIINDVHTDRITGVKFLNNAVDSSPYDGGDDNGSVMSVASGCHVNMPPSIVTCSSDSSITITSLLTGNVIVRIPEAHPYSAASCMDITPDHQGIAVTGGSKCKSLRFWDLELGKLVDNGGTLTGHEGHVTCVKFCEGGRRVLSSSNDGTVRLWDCISGRCVRKLVEGHTGWVLSCAVTPDGKKAVSGGDDKLLCSWDLYEGKCMEVKLGHQHWISSVDISPNGNLALTGSQDGSVRLWDLRRNKKPSVNLTGYSGAVNVCRMFRWKEHLSPNGVF